jgi:Ca2+-binding EF-hand superfamily protein
MDLDYDDRITIAELWSYVQLSGVPIPEETVHEMFREASSQRAITHEP